MDVFVYKKAVEEICKENRIDPGSFFSPCCSKDCILKKHKLCNGFPETADSIINVVDKIDDKSVKIVHDWLHHESVTVQ